MAQKKESPTASPAPKKKSPAPKTQKGRRPKAPKKKPAATGVVPVVGIGASAGGLDALSKFFQAMPADSGNAFVVVQHLDPHHKSLMADLLAKHTAMEVVQAESSMAVEPNHVYVIAPNTYLTLAGGELRVSEPITVRGMRMPIDYFFRSLGESRQEKAICIVLSGTATDGTLGLRAVKSHGGLALVQDPTTATHDGMPVSAISTGMVDLVLPVEEMPEAIIKYVQHPFIRYAAKAGSVPEHAQTELQSIFSLLRARVGHDFKWYKKTTLVRRIQRRIGLHHLDNYAQYTEYLRNHSQEVNQLFKDLLISVTDWFRDPQAWEDLKTDVLPHLFERQERSAHPLRIWVPGCATGEEAYSLAILLTEVAEERQEPPDFLIFATDVNRDSLEIARNGVYPDAIGDEVSPERLARYFTREGQFFTVKKPLRESIVFAQQNLISDPPFSKLDLVSCRNLLIYLEPEIQKKIIALFHFSLNQNGFLFLGNSEGLSQQKNLFDTVSKKWRIFRKIGITRANLEMPIPLDEIRYEGLNLSGRIKAQTRLPRLVDVAREILLDRFVPATVLINSAFQVLYFHGPHENYLVQPPGEPTTDLLSIAREGLRTRLRGALHTALKKNEEIVLNDGRVKRGESFYRVKVTVTPLRDHDEQQAAGLLLVTFEDIKPAEKPEHPENDYGKTDEAVVHQLEEELRLTKEELQSTIEELETSNEELKSSNEEVMSMNEELQSANEELETSKEELQSMNEELTTVNVQLEEKIKEVETANDDLNNLLSSTELATIFLDTNLRIKRYTPAVQEIFHYLPSDVGRPLTDLSHHALDPDLPRACREVLDHLQPDEREIRTEKGEWFIRRTLPYRTEDNRIAGVVVTFSDVSQIKQAEEQLHKAKGLAEAVNDLNETIHSTLDFNKIIRRVTTKAIAPIGIEAAAIGLLDGEDFEFQFAHHMPAHFEGQRLPLADLKGIDLALRTREVVSAADAVSDPRLSAEPIKQFGIRALMIAPLIVRGKAVGTLNFYCLSGPFEFTEVQRDYARKVADSVSLAIENARLYRELQGTERVAQRRLAEVLGIYAAAPVGLCFVDPDLRYVKISNRLAAMDGPTVEEHLGRTVREILPGLADTIEPHYRQVLTTGEPLEDVEFRGTRPARPDEERIWLSSYYPVKDEADRVLGVNAVVRDITERKETEQELRRSNEELEQFAYVASHDLKEPLRMVTGFLDLLQRRYQGKLDAEADEFIGFATEGAARMSQLIDDLLEFSRIGARGRPFAPTAMEEILAKGMRDLKANIKETGAVIEHKPLPRVLGDEGQLVQLMENLLANALKFTGGRKPEVRISAEKEKQEDGLYRFAVHDNGIGLDSRQADRIFSIFQRLHTRKEYPGTGMGLAICKKIVERHGGRIWVESKPGKGSTFYFTLASAPPEPAA